jgi:uncharacterized membrane protein HdeD (DUF308 family)
MYRAPMYAVPARMYAAPVSSLGADEPLADVLAARLPRWWVPVLVGVLAVIAGIVSLVWPGPTLLLIGICFGIYLIFAGVGGLITAFAVEGLSTFLRIVEVVLGLLTLLAGMILVVRPGASVAVVAFVLGFWFLLSGSLQLARGVGIADGRWFNIGFGLLGIVVGIVVLAQPGIGVATLVLVVGIGFILNGLIAIALGVSLRGIQRRGGSSEAVTA